MLSAIPVTLYLALFRLRQRLIEFYLSISSPFQLPRLLSPLMLMPFQYLSRLVLELLQQLDSIFQALVVGQLTLLRVLQSKH